ncbi:MAG: hypothetical protein LBJ57_00240, partial [Prevotellaceae bacterium]|nr:hypothetical protein [Prevotellaceae bacterium]
MSENIGISQTSKKENSAINASNSHIPNGMSIQIIAIDAKNSALAGVGNPQKEVACRSSMLNFAKRKAEKTVSKNGEKISNVQASS